MKRLGFIVKGNFAEAQAHSEKALLQMSGDLQQQREFHRQYEEACKATTRLSKPPR